MNKALIQQMTKAMQDNAMTIYKQELLIERQDHKIADLTHSLETLAETQTQELKELPALFESLKTSLDNNSAEQRTWWQNQQAQSKKQSALAEQLMTLVKTQMQLTTALQQYQSTLAPAQVLGSDLAALETMLTTTSQQLMDTQSRIQDSQKTMNDDMKQLERLLNK